MNYKRLTFLIIGAALLLTILLLVWKKTPSASPENPVPIFARRTPVIPPSAPPTPRAATDAPRFNTMQDYRRELSTRPVVPAPANLPGVKTPSSELAQIKSTVRKYHAAFGQNPVGSNPEITRALLGKNPSGAKFLDPVSTSLNQAGEWLDSWGTPYYFHPVSGAILELRSAGPDCRLFTSDDLVQ